MSVSRKVLRKMKKAMGVIGAIPVLTACSSQISCAGRTDGKAETHIVIQNRAQAHYSDKTLYFSGNGIIDDSWKKCYNQESVRRVVIENGIEKIDDQAFDSCTSLKEITIPNSVTEIGESAFNCCGFEKITMNGVTKIGSNAFAGCEYLGEIVIPCVTEIGKGAFNHCGFKEITLPNSLTKIDECLFLYCKSLYKISLPINITSIGRCAFLGCESLEKITLPGSLNTIDEWAFCSCQKLNAVKFGNGDYKKNITLERGVFDNCEELRYFDTNGRKLRCIDGNVFNNTPFQYLRDEIICGKYHFPYHQDMVADASLLDSINDRFNNNGDRINPANCPLYPFSNPGVRDKAQ